jgi:methionine-rich copper-binding protein CopC
VRNLKRIQVVFSLITIFVALFSNLPQSANASGFLVSSSPSSDQHLTDPPAEISLLFSVGTLPASLKGDVIRVTNSAGIAVDNGETKTSGMTMSIGMRQDIHPDRYQVAYRYVCDDGHVLVGAYSFVLTKVEASVPTTTPSPQNVKAKPKASVSSSTGKSTPEPTPSASPAQVASESTGSQSPAPGVDSSVAVGTPAVDESSSANANFSPVWILFWLACAIGFGVIWITVRRLIRRN